MCIRDRDYNSGEVTEVYSAPKDSILGCMSMEDVYKRQAEHLVLGIFSYSAGVIQYKLSLVHIGRELIAHLYPVMSAVMPSSISTASLSIFSCCAGRTGGSMVSSVSPCTLCLLYTSM